MKREEVRKLLNISDATLVKLFKANLLSRTQISGSKQYNYNDEDVKFIRKTKSIQAIFHE